MSIYNLISENQIEKAIMCLQIDENDKILLISRWNTLQKDSMRGTLYASEYTVQRNQIVKTILDYSKENPIQTKEVDKITILQELKKKVRFGFTQQLKDDLEYILGKLLDYSDQKKRNELYDVDERMIEKLNHFYDQFIANHQRELRTQEKVKIAGIKKALDNLENDLTKSNLEEIIQALIAMNTKYTYLADSLSKLSDWNLTSFASQVADIVDQL